MPDLRDRKRFFCPFSVSLMKCETERKSTVGKRKVKKRYRKESQRVPAEKKIEKRIQ